MQTETKLTGKVVSWNPRGFGFIRTTEKYEYFFHVNDVVGIDEKDIKLGLEVVFVLGSYTKGVKAIEIERRKDITHEADYNRG